MLDHLPKTIQVKDLLTIPMVKHMKEIIRMERDKAKENTLIQMEMYMKEIL